MANANTKYLLMPTVLTDKELAKFAYTEEWFYKVNEIGAPLYDAANTNLRPFQERGGKLIVWHGLEDNSVEPQTSVFFYQGVQKEMGEKFTDSFMRLFMIPGVGHCGGGEGFPQVDVLTPLMTWTEMKKAPEDADRRQDGQHSGWPRWSRRRQQALSGGGSGHRCHAPGLSVALRCQVQGNGDPKDAASFEPAKVPETLPIDFHTEASKLLGPGHQVFHVANGKLVAESKNRVRQNAVAAAGRERSRPATA